MWFVYVLFALLLLFVVFAVVALAIASNNNPRITTFTVGVTPAGIAVTPDNQFAYVSNNNNYSIPGSDSVTVLDLAHQLPLTTITDPSFNQPYTVTISNNVAYVTNSGSGTVTLIDTMTNVVLGTLVGFDGPSAMAINNEGTVGFVANYGAAGGLGSGNGKTISVVDLLNKTITKTIVVDQAPAALLLKDELLYVANYVDGNIGTGTLNVIDTATNLVTAKVAGFSGPFGIAFANQNMYVSNFGSNNFEPYGTTVSVVSTKTLTIIKTITVGIQPSGIAASPNGKRIYVSNYNTLYTSNMFTNLVAGQGTINVIDTSTNTVITPTLVVAQSPSNIAVAGNGTIYVSNYTSNTVTGVTF